MKLFVRALFPVAVVILSLAGCHSRQIEVVDHPRQFAGVAEQDVTFYSAALQHNATYRVYLPASPSGRLAVVCLLHGGGGDYRDWSLYSDVGKYAARGLILDNPLIVTIPVGERNLF